MLIPSLPPVGHPPKPLHASPVEASYLPATTPAFSELRQKSLGIRNW